MPNSAATTGARNAVSASLGDESAGGTRRAPSSVFASEFPLQPPAGSIYFGAYVNVDKSLGPYEEQTAQFEQEIGRPLAVHSEYYAWTDSFPGAQEEDDYSHGRLPVISWDCGESDYAVAQGKYDNVIKARAQAFKEYHHLVMVRFFWEMNLPDSDTDRLECYDKVHDEAGGVFSPTQYVAAWTHIRAVFAAQGVTNVVWLWNPSGSTVIKPMPYYPGASETDWVGFDHYDVTGESGLLATLMPPYEELVGLGKPIMVGETGTVAKNQPIFLDTAPEILKKNFPLIYAFIYYDAYGHRQDWRLTKAGITAFKTAGKSKYFSAFVKK